MAYSESVVRLMMAFVIGGLIGWERERNNRPAGLRTYIIVCVSACLALIISTDLFRQYEGRTNMDPSRMAAYVISGIGFLGAGTIMREGASVKGLTTAASLWGVALLGIAVGAGLYPVAWTAAGMILFTLLVMNKLEQSLRNRFQKPRLAAEQVVTAETLRKIEKKKAAGKGRDKKQKKQSRAPSGTEQMQNI